MEATKPVDYLLNKLFRLSTRRAYAGLRNDPVYYLLERHQTKPFSTPVGVLEALNAYTPAPRLNTFYNDVKRIVEAEIAN